jgi:hypothetical protein
VVIKSNRNKRVEMQKAVKRSSSMYGKMCKARGKSKSGMHGGSGCASTPTTMAIDEIDDDEKGINWRVHHHQHTTMHHFSPSDYRTN